MLPETSRTQDLAITSLLEQYQKQNDQHQYTWTDQRIPKSTHKSKQTPPYLGYKPSKPRTLFKQNVHQSSKRDSYNPEMLESSGVDANQWLEVPASRRNAGPEKSNYQIEGSYWWGKVNWTSFGHQETRQGESKSKQQKRTAYDYSQRKNNNRYEQYQRSKEEEYKTNLIYSILKKEEKTIKQQSGKRKSKSNMMHQSLLELTQDKGEKDSSMRHWMKEAMRESLRKFVVKNKEEGIGGHYSLEKKDQQRRSSFVRQLLNNMNPTKVHRPDSPLLIPKKSQKTPQSPSSKPEFRKTKPPRAMYLQNSQQTQHSQEKTGRVLDLNMQAERVYKTRSVNRRSQMHQMH